MLLNAIECHRNLSPPHEQNIPTISLINKLSKAKYAKQRKKNRKEKEKKFKNIHKKCKQSYEFKIGLQTKNHNKPDAYKVFN